MRKKFTHYFDGTFSLLSVSLLIIIYYTTILQMIPFTFITFII